MGRPGLTHRVRVTGVVKGTVETLGRPKPGFAQRTIDRRSARTAKYSEFRQPIAINVMIPRPLLSTLAVLAVGLPIVVVVLLAVSAILGAMGDANGQLAVTWVGRAAGILWIIDLVLLLISLAIETLDRDTPRDDKNRRDKA
jgi:hypothetical protein